MPTVSLKETHPQAIFSKPDEIDLFITYLERLETIEGVSRKEFVKKVLNAD